MTPEQEERLIESFELISTSMSSIARTMEMEYAKKYPPKGEVRPFDLIYKKSEEEQMREDQGDTGEETVEDWLSLSERERRFYEQQGINESDYREARNRQEKTGKLSEDY